FVHEINGQNQIYKGFVVVGPEGLRLEDQKGESGKDQQAEDLLVQLRVNEAEGTTVVPEPDPVGRDLEDVPEPGNAASDQDDGDQAQFVEPFPFVELQMSVPGQYHKGIAQDQQSNGQECFHRFQGRDRVVLRLFFTRSNLGYFPQ